MKLLYDQNLSYRLVDLLTDVFPGSVHVREAGLEKAGDEEVWEYAAGHGLGIVSKDADFHQLSFMRGHPPKVIWIRRGNCNTCDVAEILRGRREEVRRFGNDREQSFLALS